MARELSPGDNLRGIAGVHAFDEIKPAGIGPVFNLEVADTGTFFVGESGWLVHDNTIPEFRGPIYDASPVAEKAGVAGR